MNQVRVKYKVQENTKKKKNPDGRDFPHSSIPAFMPTHLPVQTVLSLFPGSKAAGARR
jgi:hypothetical protein